MTTPAAYKTNNAERTRDDPHGFEARALEIVSRNKAAKKKSKMDAAAATTAAVFVSPAKKTRPKSKAKKTPPKKIPKKTLLNDYVADALATHARNMEAAAKRKSMMGAKPKKTNVNKEADALAAYRRKMEKIEADGLAAHRRNMEAAEKKKKKSTMGAAATTTVAVLVSPVKKTSTKNNPKTTNVNILADGLAPHGRKMKGTRGCKTFPSAKETKKDTQTTVEAAIHLAPAAMEAAPVSSTTFTIAPASFVLPAAVPMLVTPVVAPPAAPVAALSATASRKTRIAPTSLVAARLIQGCLGEVVKDNGPETGSDVNGTRRFVQPPCFPRRARQNDYFKRRSPRWTKHIIKRRHKPKPRPTKSPYERLLPTAIVQIQPQRTIRFEFPPWSIIPLSWNYTVPTRAMRYDREVQLQMSARYRTEHSNAAFQPSYFNPARWAIIPSAWNYTGPAPGIDAYWDERRKEDAWVRSAKEQLRTMDRSPAAVFRYNPVPWTIIPPEWSNRATWVRPAQEQPRTTHRSPAEVFKYNPVPWMIIPPSWNYKQAVFQYNPVPWTIIPREWIYPQTRWPPISSSFNHNPLLIQSPTATTMSNDASASTTATNVVGSSLACLHQEQKTSVPPSLQRSPASAPLSSSADHDDAAKQHAVDYATTTSTATPVTSVLASPEAAQQPPQRIAAQASMRQNTKQNKMTGKRDYHRNDDGDEDQVYFWEDDGDDDHTMFPRLRRRQRREDQPAAFLVAQDEDDDEADLKLPASATDPHYSLKPPPAATSPQNDDDEEWDRKPAARQDWLCPGVVSDDGSNAETEPPRVLPFASMPERDDEAGPPPGDPFKGMDFASAAVIRQLLKDDEALAQAPSVAPPATARVRRASFKTRQSSHRVNLHGVTTDFQARPSAKKRGPGEFTQVTTKKTRTDKSMSGRNSVVPSAAGVVDRLPVQPSQQIKDADAEDCPICLEPMGDVDAAMTRPCEHKVHVGCLKVWIDKHDSCVVCRQTVDSVLSNRFGEMPLDAMRLLVTTRLRPRTRDDSR